MNCIADEKETMNTQEIINAAVILAQRSRLAGKYATYHAVDSAIENGDATVQAYEDGWTIFSETQGCSIKVQRADVKPIIAKMLDAMTTGEAKSWHFPIVPGMWDRRVAAEVAQRIYNLPTPISPVRYGKELEKIETIASMN